MLQACSRLIPAAHRLARHPVHAEQDKIVRVAIIRADADALLRGAELRDRLDRLRQRMPGRRGRAAAQENPHARIEQIVGDLAVDRLMRVGDAARCAGRHELASVDVARDRPAALQRRGEDRVAALVAHGHGHEIHLLAERRRLRPAVEESPRSCPASGRRPPFPVPAMSRAPCSAR